MKIDRLLGITIYLLNHNKTRAQTLAQQFEVSLRTIRRDIESLCMAGIPVVSSYGAGGGYEILDTFRMERQIAGQADYSYILTALQGFASAYKSKELDSVLEKIQSSSSGIPTNMVLDFGVLGENKTINETLSILEKAVKEKHVLTFSYTNADNIQKEFEVEPVAVMYKWYSWYLLSYYPKYSDYRLFKLHRMEDINVTNRQNSKEHDVTKAKEKWEHQGDSRKYLDIKLYCSSEIKTKCLEYLKGEVERELDNGDLILNFSAPENEQFWYGTLLSLGNKVKVLEPEELRIKLCNSCKEILLLYENV